VLDAKARLMAKFEANENQLCLTKVSLMPFTSPQIQVSSAPPHSSFYHCLAVSLQKGLLRAERAKLNNRKAPREQSPTLLVIF